MIYATACMALTRRMRSVSRMRRFSRGWGVYTTRGIGQAYGYLFREGVQSLCNRSTQYLIKWISSFRMAENVIAREKLKHSGGEPVDLRRRRRGKGRKRSKGGDQALGRAEAGGSGSHINHKVRAYSTWHHLWLDGDEDRRDKLLETDNFWGGTGIPPDGNVGIHSTSTNQKGYV